MQSQTPESLARSTIVRAGAGAGKTTALTEQVLNVAKEFYKTNERYPRIVVTTFTKKATQELKERLVLLALHKDRELLEFVNSSSVLKISTIHGILDQYLRQYGSFLNLDPSFSVINWSAASQLARQVIRKILLTHEEKETLQQLIDDFSFNRLESLCREYYRFKIQYPQMKPYSLENLITIQQEYVKNFAGEIDELVRSIQSEENNPKWLTYAEQMQILAHELRHKKWAESYDFLKNLNEQMPGASRTAKIQISDATYDAKGAVTAKLKDLFEEPSFHPSATKDFAEMFARCQKLFDSFAEQFMQAKLQMALVEINDLELFSLKLSREFTETAKAFSDEWDYWLIDEYQDTSPVQVELIEMLSQGKPQYVVGDPQQSIYLFRGARSEVFQNRETEILARAGEKLEKIHNYRSRPELLEFFNDFFKKLRIPFSPMIAHRPENYVAQTGPIAKFFISEIAKEEVDEVTDQETLAIVEHIGSLVEQDVRLEDICILARTNKNLNDISKVLTASGLLNHVHISSGFYQRREVQDALALYKFLVHPHNNLNLLVLLRSPWFLVDEQFLVDHIDQAPNSYWLHLSQFKMPAIERLSLFLNRVQEVGLSNCFLEALISSGIFDFSKQEDTSGRKESNLWKLIAILKEEEAKPGFNPLDLVAQIEMEMRLGDDGEGDAVTAIEPQRINLMTIHSSKGLQFRHVIIPRMNKKPKTSNEPEFLYDEDIGKWSMKIPFGPEEKMTGSLIEQAFVEKMKESEIAEHARVLYVAMTRAIDSVFLCWTNKSEKNSWSEMIQWDLTTGLHESENYQYEVLTGEAKPRVFKTQQLTPLRQRPSFSRMPVEATRNFSVTEIIEQDTFAKAKEGVASADWLESFKVVSKGSLTHKLMQAAKYSNDIDDLVTRWFPSQEKEIHRALQFMQNLEAPPLAKLIEQGFVEMGFSFREDGHIIDGQIDLWGIVDDEVWIIDYKTGSIRYKDKAFLQLEYYAKALKKSTMISDTQKIRLAVIYPFTEKVFLK